MYYTELDPRTMKPVYVAKSPHEKAMQRALIQYRDPKNYELVTEALIEVGRKDLVGNGEKCLIRARHCDLRFVNSKPQETKGKNTKAASKPAGRFSQASIDKKKAENAKNTGKKGRRTEKSFQPKELFKKK